MISSSAKPLRLSVAVRPASISRHSCNHTLSLHFPFLSIPPSKLVLFVITPLTHTHTHTSPMTPSSSTASEALATLRATLDSLITPPRPFLHSLCTPSLPPTRHKLKASLSSLEKAAQARESWDDVSADKLLRVKLDAVMKKRSVQDARKSLRLCKMICERDDPFGGGGDIAWKVLKAIAEEVGAITDKTTSPNAVQLTVCGSTYLVDFEFVDLRRQQVSVTVKFRFLVDNNEKPDASVSKSFETLVKASQFDKLKTAITRLVELENLSNRVGIGLQDALRAFEEDLLMAQQVEKKDNMRLSDRQMLGHGIVSRSALGLQIEFCPGYRATLGMEACAREMTISWKSGQLLMKGMSGTIPEFEFANRETTNVEACYVLRFERDLIMCVSLAQMLDRLTASPRKREKDDKRSNTWPSLQKLLAEKAFGGGERQHWSLDSSEYNATTEINGMTFNFVHSGTDLVPGVAVDRIPLCHVSQVKSVLNVLRQQLIFNKLFQSCFDTDASLDGGDPVRVETVVCDAPAFLQFSWVDPTARDMVCMGVKVERGGSVQVTFSGASVACSNAKASAILNACFHVPLTINTILKMGRSQ